MFIDSHCHLNYLDDPKAALLAANHAGVDGCLCIGVEQSSIEEVLDAAALNAAVWATVGEHPGSCSGDASWVANYIDREDVVAVGEMGLDYLYSTESADHLRQQHTFTQQMAIATEANLPVVIHTRNAQEDTLKIMSEHADVTGVLHCFTESWGDGRTSIGHGLLHIHFWNCHLQQCG